MKITDQDLHTAISNGDGTFSGVKLCQWLVEAVGGRPLSEEDARQMLDDAKQKIQDRKRGL